jgi:hypothetical protein
MTASSCAKFFSSIHHLNKDFDAPNNKPNKKDCRDKSLGKVSHLSIHTAEKIVPAIDKIMTPAVRIMMPSMRFSLALICS